MEELSTYVQRHPTIDREVSRSYLEWLGQSRRAEDPKARWVGPFRLLRELGAGGQGTVHLAEDSILKRRVALKLLRWQPDPDRMKRFHREARIASRLDHPGICAVYGSDSASGVAYIAMRYVEGTSLSERIGKGTLEREESVRIIERCARALQAAHEARVIHRDLKPSNVMVSPGGDPVLLDFGLALSDDLQETLTRSGDLPGTPAFMPPEQLRGETVDARSDVYSLAATLFNCLKGERPFDGKDAQELFRNILQAPLPDLPGIPRDLAIIVRKGMSRDREQRYATAGEFADDLSNYLQRRPIVARPTPWWRQFRLWARRNRAIAATLLGSFLFLGTALILTLSALGDRSEALAARFEALDKERGERRARETAISRTERLSDVALAGDLLKRSEELWPRRPEMVPEFETWLARARGLAERLPEHEAELRRVEARALPEDAVKEREERERRDPELMADIASREREIAAHDARMEKLPPLLRRLNYGETQRRKGFVEMLEALRSRVDWQRRLVWEFEDPSDVWRHGVLRRLVERANKVVAGIDGLDERRRFALSIRDRSRTIDAEAWRRCLNDLKNDARFVKLDLTPRIGLVPLGKDGDSGLWEFWHPGSGPRPGWKPSAPGALTGKLEAKGSIWGQVLVLLPPGSFFMGSTRKEGPHHDPDAAPIEWYAQKVVLDAFLISKFELTRAQWRTLVPDPGPQPAGVNLVEGPDEPAMPVSRLTWHEARELAHRWGLLLPTECQWEYACRAGSTTRWFTGAEPETLRGYANLADLPSAKAHCGFRAPIPWECDPGFDDGFFHDAPVGNYRANAFGVHDMIGNLAEWCRDECEMYFECFPRAGDGLRFDPFSRERIVRGGCYTSLPRKARSGWRIFADTEMRGGEGGVRLASSWPLREGPKR